MSFSMIDIAIADKVRSTIAAGDEVEFIAGPDKRMFLFKVLEIKPYSFIVTSSSLGGVVQKLELPVSKTLAYITEIENMRVKMPPAADSGQPATRGRPRKDAAAPPAPPPPQAAPIGIQYASPAAPVPTPAPAAFPQPLPAPSPASAVEADVDPNWITNAIEEACSNFAEEMKTILQGIIATAEAATQEPGDGAEMQLQCFDCVFCNIEGNRCDKFNMTPPMHVIADAANKCPDFLNATATGGGLDDEIPF